MKWANATGKWCRQISLRKGCHKPSIGEKKNAVSKKQNKAQLKRARWAWTTDMLGKQRKWGHRDGQLKPQKAGKGWKTKVGE